MRTLPDDQRSRKVRRVLAVSAERHILRLVEVNLQRAGYDVDVATTVDEGLQLALATPPDLVVYDGPPESAAGFREQLKAHPATAGAEFLHLEPKVRPPFGPPPPQGNRI